MISVTQVHPDGTRSRPIAARVGIDFAGTIDVLAAAEQDSDNPEVERERLALALVAAATIMRITGLDALADIAKGR